jgi:dTMP kinase
MSTWIANLAGRFLVLDGPDGSGKSTQFARFAALCREGGLDVCEVREPGGTSIGEQIRRVLLDPANTDMSLRCEMMLYMASRAQLIEEIIRPARAAGRFVLADRFISSTLAYQGTAGGLAAADILAVGGVAIDEHWPDLTVIFDVDDATAARRMSGVVAGVRQPSLFDDRIEARADEYHQQVRQGYLDQAANDPDHYLVIDGTQDEDAVFDDLLAGVRGRINS